MDEKTKKIVSGIIYLIIFIASLTLVIVGQRNVGLQGTLVMLVGLAGLIFLLYRYNKKYK